MKKRLLLPLALTAAVFTACTDDSYDLSNVDTTARLAIDNYQLPINIDKVELKQIMDINEDNSGKIKIIDGVYAIQESGEFNSDAITINKPSIAKPSVEIKDDNVTVNVFDKLSSLPENLNGYSLEDLKNISNPIIKEQVKDIVKDEQMLLHFDIPVNNKELSFTAENVDSSIEDITAIGIDDKLNIHVTFPKLAAKGIIGSYEIKGLKFYMPKGFTATVNKGSYDSEKGEWTVGNLVISENLDIVLEMDIKGVDIPKDAFDNQTLSFKESVKAEGAVEIYVRNFKNTATLGAIRNLNNIDYKCNIDFDHNITVESFSGKVNYDVKNINVDPVDLSDIPDFLSEKGTSIILANPQIYLSVNNPLKEKDQDVTPKASIQLIPDPVSVNEFKKDFELSKASNVICFSPEPVSKYIEGYENATHENFDIKGILQSKKDDETILPKKISFDVKAGIKQSVNNIKLGSYAKVSGKWAFFTPLDLGDGSIIKYNEEDTGWLKDSEDMDKIHVKSLKINATVSSDIPFDASLDVYPLAVDGKPLEDVSFSQVTIPANQTKEINIELKINKKSGELQLSELDGVKFNATVLAKGGKSLAPTQNIKLSNLKVYVSGYAQDKF